MDTNIEKRLQEQLDEQEIKINQIYESVKRTERYLKWTFWVTVIIVVLPAILLVFAVPAFISTYTSALGGGDINNTLDTLNSLNNLRVK